MAEFNANTLPYVPTNAPASQQIAAINRIVDIINSFQNSITFSDGQSRRMFIGYQKDGWGTGKDFGMKVSIPGKDVMTAADSELLFKMDIESWYWYNAGVPRILLGRAPTDGRTGFWISEPGVDVNTTVG